MSGSSNDRPAILIDQKRTRIRIYKRTLHMLGAPQFIQLLVNPVALTVAIRPRVQADALAHRIVWSKLVDKQSYELYSGSFVRKLQSICMSWKDGASYKLIGEMLALENIALFDLSKALPVSSVRGDDNE